MVLVNSHMSAYDEGGVIRSQQLEMLTSFMAEEYKKGNWVIIGGDFNHVLGEEYLDAFPSQQVVPVVHHGCAGNVVHGELNRGLLDSVRRL